MTDQPADVVTDPPPTPLVCPTCGAQGRLAGAGPTDLAMRCPAGHAWRRPYPNGNAARGDPRLPRPDQRQTRRL